jgi:hypothetical protein
VDVEQWLLGVQEGNSALHMAAKSGGLGIVYALLDAGADASLPNKVGGCTEECAGAGQCPAGRFVYVLSVVCHTLCCGTGAL